MIGSSVIKVFQVDGATVHTKEIGMKIPDDWAEECEAFVKGTYHGSSGRRGAQAMGVVNFAASTGGRYVDTITIHEERRQVPYTTRLAQEAREAGLMQRAFFRNCTREAWLFVCKVCPDMNKFMAIPAKHRLYVIP